MHGSMVPTLLIGLFSAIEPHRKINKTSVVTGSLPEIYVKA